MAAPRPYRLRQDSEGPGREAKAVCNFRPSHHDHRTGGGHLIQISHRLDLPMALLEKPDFGIQRFFDVGIQRLMANGRHTTLLE